MRPKREAMIWTIIEPIQKIAKGDFSVKIRNEEKYNGELLLTSLANGSYCGGGIKSNPLASYNDGYININIISSTRSIFLRILFMNMFLKKC